MKFRRGRIGNGLAVLAGARPDVLAARRAPARSSWRWAACCSARGAGAGVDGVRGAHGAGRLVAVRAAGRPGLGLVVVNLDRMLLVGMAHDASLKRNLVLAVPRVGLALVLGVVIATPLTLQIFAKEIDTEIVTMQAESADAYRASLADDARFAHLPELEERIASRRPWSPAGSGRRGPRGGARRGAGSPGRTRCRGRRLARARGQGAVRARRLVRHRRRGHGTGLRAGPGGCRRPGGGRGGGAVGTGRRRGCGVGCRGRSASLAASSLDTDRAELARLTAEQDRLQASFDATNEGSGGLLLRLEALDRLGDRNGTLAAAQFMLSLLFMSVEILPVLMKMLLNFSPPTPTTAWPPCATPATWRSRSWRRSRGRPWRSRRKSCW